MILIGDKSYSSDELRHFLGKRVDVRQDPAEPEKACVNPPGRARVIEVSLINPGGPTAEILDDARERDIKRLGSSSTPGVSRSEELRSTWVKQTEETQQRLKDEKAQRTAPPPAPRLEPPAPTLTPLPTIRRLNKPHHV